MGRAVAESRGGTALLTPDEWRSGLGSFGAVLRTGLAPILDTRSVEGAADDVIANPGEILDATTANEHNRVLLQVVADAWDVGSHFKP
jgi:hypothetical protein